MRDRQGKFVNVGVLGATDEQGSWIEKCGGDAQPTAEQASGVRLPLR